MRIELKPFQEESVKNLLLQLSLARNEVRLGGNTQAIILAAPTGSGKTVMATAMMEAMIEGDGDTPGDPNATLLWITDQPELNEQTRRSVLWMSNVFGSNRVVTLDASFDEEALPPGFLYFLNIQKLREGALLVTSGDKRNNTMWETISRTIEERATSFCVVLDEAHKGMAQSAADRRRAQSIVQKFVKGSAGEIPPAPLIFGISATPHRFEELLQGTNRVARKEEVSVDAVRASGLLKETLHLFHPDEDQPADTTLLKAAAARLREYGTHWHDYHDRTGTEELVRPILVVQVEDASHQRPITKTNIGEVLSTVEDVLGPLEPQEVAHAFQEGSTLEVDDRLLRYCAPADIQDDPKIRVVLFKMSLNTGWDCPRAESMMSFRRAKDYVYIAQLVGRMVRTPLARRIETDEFLNTVGLYLPHYDQEGLQRVLDYLHSPDPGVIPPTEVERGETAISLGRNPHLSDCFKLLRDEVPTYSIPTVRRTNDVRRLMKLARLLANDDIVKNAVAEARQLVVEVLREARVKSEKSTTFHNVVREGGVLDLREVAYAYGLETYEESRLKIPVTQENIDDLFASAGRKLGDGLHKTYWKSRAEEDISTSKRRGKLELVALVGIHQVMTQLDEVARTRVQQWQKDYRHAVNELSGERQNAYDEIRGSAGQPELGYMARMPEFIMGKTAGTHWQHHAYEDEEGRFPYDFRSSWEPIVIQEEQARNDYVGFLRNEDRKPYSLAVPYQADDGRIKPLFPDFLVFRRGPNEDLIVDILDPHSSNLGDWWQKAKGLAQYAERHGRLFGRIELIVVEDEKTKRINLTEDGTRRRVLSVTTSAHLKDIFARA